MPRCAFLTMADLQGFVCDDELAYPFLRTLGWEVEAVPWRRGALGWDQFDGVVIRSTWDYHQAPEEFLAVLGQIQQTGVPLENSLALVRWNLHKTYLRDLAQRGVRSVSTIWGSEFGPVEEKAILDRLHTDEAVLKPVIGASAMSTYRLRRGSPGWAEAARAFPDHAYLAQPFLRQVLSEGEYSLFYFGGQLSHAVRKTPRLHDFRVQEEYGGTITAVNPSHALVQASERVMAAIGEVPLYARVDLISMEDGGYGLMELELIEPSLYLRMDANAPARFAQALDMRFRSSFVP